MNNRIGSGWSSNNTAAVDGKKVEPTSDAESNMERSNDVGSDFFGTLGVPILMGREFTDADTAASQKVAVVNELFAQRFLPHQDPLGHHVAGMFKDEDMVIVGVAKNNKYTGMQEDPIPMVWYDYAQAPLVGAMHVELRVLGDPMAVLPAARKVVAQMDPDVPLTQPILQRKQFENTISQELMFARLAGFFRAAGDGAGGDRALRHAFLSSEYAHGGDWRAHGCGRPEGTGGMDDSKGQPDSDGGGGGGGCSAGHVGGARVGVFPLRDSSARRDELFPGDGWPGGCRAGSERCAGHARGQCRSLACTAHGMIAAQ
jgi:hypothetical protein